MLAVTSILGHLGNAGKEEDAMFKRSVAATFATVASVAFSSLLLTAGPPSPAHAAEIKLLGPVSLRTVLPSLLPQFEQSSGHKVVVGYATLGAITKRLVEGEVADVAMVSPDQNAELQKQGKLLAGSRVEIARVGFTVFVKKGAPKPEVRSGTEVAEVVAKGEAEIGIGVASDAAIIPGLDAFPLPAGAQSYSVYVAGVSSGSTQVDVATALIAFLTSPAVKQALTTNGFETP